jgi:hypothetical protein
VYNIIKRKLSRTNYSIHSVKVININVKKWNRKESKGIERKEKEDHEKKIL